MVLFYCLSDCWPSSEVDTIRVLKFAGETISNTSKSGEHSISRCAIQGRWLMASPFWIVRTPSPSYSKVAEPFKTSTNWNEHS